MIPFSPPRIDQRVIDEVTDALKSGWITTGPKTKLFEKKLSEYCGNKSTAALNSWANAMELFLRWYGIGEGDEVILPAYTYCASINVIIHTGARPVLVDINEDDFNMSVEAVKKVITSRTKAIMPVDIGGFPCDYDSLFELVRSQEIRNKFTAKNENEKK